MRAPKVPVRASIHLPLVILGLALSLGAHSSVAADDDGFVSIFDGKTTNGWVAEGLTSYFVGATRTPIWTAKEGILRCDGKGFGFLRYDKPLTDFVVRLEFKMGKDCNSGVGIRSLAFTGARNSRPSMSGYEIQILDDVGAAPSTKGTGSLYRYVAPKSNPVKAGPAWNEFEVRCEGPRIRVTLNGQVIQDVDQSTIAAIKDKPLKGYFSVQNHGKQIEFRNIRLKDLAAAPVGG